MNFGMKGIQKKILNSENFGAVGAIILKPTIDAMLDRFVPQQKLFGNFGLDDGAEMILGAYMMKGKGLMHGFGKMLIVLNLANLVGGFMQGGFSLMTPNAAQAEAVYVE